MHRHTIIATIFLAASGCGFSGPDATHSGTTVIDTLESGIVQVRNSPPPDRYLAPSWVIEEELRIGTADGTGPDLFGEVRGIEVDDEGRMGRG